MKKRGHHIMIFLVLVYAMHLFLKFSHISVPVWFSSYFADLLCIPILLYLTIESMKKLKINRIQYLSKAMILTTWIYVSLVFEWYLPRLSERYTSDPWDVLMYGIGALFFYMIQKRYLRVDFPKAHKSENRNLSN